MPQESRCQSSASFASRGATPSQRPFKSSSKGTFKPRMFWISPFRFCSVIRTGLESLASSQLKFPLSRDSFFRKTGPGSRLESSSSSSLSKSVIHSNSPSVCLRIGNSKSVNRIDPRSKTKGSNSNSPFSVSSTSHWPMVWPVSFEINLASRIRARPSNRSHSPTGSNL